MSDDLPKEIYLQWHGDGDSDEPGEVFEPEVSWCRERVYDGDIRYVREDVRAQAIREAAAEAAGKKLCEFDTDVGMYLFVPKERITEIHTAILESRVAGKEGDT